MIKKFIVCGVPRVGSNYLISLLNNHPQVLCHYEIFNPSGIFYGFSDKQIEEPNLWDIKSRDKEPFKFMDDVLRMSKEYEIVGFNVFADHNREILKNCLMDKNQKKIIQKRKDILRSFLSLKIAFKTEIWTRRAHEGNIKNKKVHFSESEFLSYLQRVHDFYNYVETLLGFTRQDYLTIYYEDIIREKNKTINAIFKYLDISDKKINLKSQYLKQNPEELEQLVENYKEMNQFFSGFDFINYFNNNKTFHNWRDQCPKIYM